MRMWSVCLFAVVMGGCAGPAPSEEEAPEDCVDGVDNDGDGSTDCDDEGCAEVCGEVLDTEADTDDSDVGPPPVTIWSGPRITFEKPNNADFTDPANQDALTDKVEFSSSGTAQASFISSPPPSPPPSQPSPPSTPPLSPPPLKQRSIGPSESLSAAITQQAKNAPLEVLLADGAHPLDPIVIDSTSTASEIWISAFASPSVCPWLRSVKTIRHTTVTRSRRVPRVETGFGSLKCRRKRVIHRIVRSTMRLMRMNRGSDRGGGARDP